MLSNELKKGGANERFGTSSSHPGILLVVADTASSH